MVGRQAFPFGRSWGYSGNLLKSLQICWITLEKVVPNFDPNRSKLQNRTISIAKRHSLKRKKRYILTNWRQKIWIIPQCPCLSLPHMPWCSDINQKNCTWRPWGFHRPNFMSMSWWALRIGKPEMIHKFTCNHEGPGVHCFALKKMSWKYTP